MLRMRIMPLYSTLLNFKKPLELNSRGSLRECLPILTVFLLAYPIVILLFAEIFTVAVFQDDWRLRLKWLSVKDYSPNSYGLVLLLHGAAY